MIKLLSKFSLLLLSFLISSNALAQNALLESLNVKKKQKWRVGLSLTHLDGFGDTRVEPGTVFGGFVDHTIRKNLHLDASLRVNKLYYIDFEDDDEVALSDAYVGLRHILKKDFIKGATPMISYGVLLPTSSYSIRQDIRSRFYLGATASWMLFNNSLILTPGIDTLLNWNGYTSTETGEQSAGGELLPLFTGTASISATLLLGSALKFKNKFLKSLLLNVNASYDRIWFEDFDIQPVSSTEFNDTDDVFRSGASVIGSPVKNWFVSVGYGNIDQVENAGRVEYNLFDSRVSRWRVGVRHTLRF